MTHIYVDADACPVKEEVERIAERHNVQVTLVADGGLRPSRHPLVRQQIVATGADAADDWIVENAKPEDIVVTGDIPLAKRCLELGASVIGHTGRIFDANSIGMAMAMRDLKQQVREANQTQTFNRSFTKADRSTFLQVLHQLVIDKLKI